MSDDGRNVRDPVIRNKFLKRNGINPDVFKDKIQGLHQSNTSYLF